MPNFNIRSHLSFSRTEQGGIVFLVSLIVVLIFLNLCVALPSEDVLELNAPHIRKHQRRLDSLRCELLEAKKPNLFPFNPNFITEYKAYTLNLSTEQFDALRAYRAQGKWINSIADFKKVTHVSQAWLDSISPFFKFPDWVRNPKPSQTPYSQKLQERYIFDEKLDLNVATSSELQRISGIGPVLGDRIVAYRKSINGFTHTIQLEDVYGLSPVVIERLKQRFEIKTPATIQQWDINKATASDLATIPGVTFDLAKEIWEFVRLREGISTLSELEKIDRISPAQLKRIQLYLSVQQPN